MPIFVGAGASFDSLPTWPDLIAKLLEEAGDTRTELTNEDFRAILDILLRREIVSDEGPSFGEDLDALGELRRLKEALSVAMSYFVAHSRASNRTWNEIGAALGTTAQNAQRNYRRLITTNFDRLLEDAIRNVDFASGQKGGLGLRTGDLPVPLQALVEAYQGELADRPRTILLVGAPGSGKTTSAYLVAAALEVDLVTVTAGDMLSRGSDNMPTHLASLLGKVGNQENVVLLLDDMDGFLGSRDNTTVEGHLMVTALIAGLSQIRKSGNALTVLTTRRDPLELDPALLRVGRMDAVVRL